MPTFTIPDWDTAYWRIHAVCLYPGPDEAYKRKACYCSRLLGMASHAKGKQFARLRNLIHEQDALNFGRFEPRDISQRIERFMRTGYMLTLLLKCSRARPAWASIRTVCQAVGNYPKYVHDHENKQFVRRALRSCSEKTARTSWEQFRSVAHFGAAEMTFLNPDEDPRAWLARAEWFRRECRALEYDGKPLLPDGEFWTVEGVDPAEYELSPLADDEISLFTSENLSDSPRSIPFDTFLNSQKPQ